MVLNASAEMHVAPFEKVDDHASQGCVIFDNEDARRPASLFMSLKKLSEILTGRLRAWFGLIDHAVGGSSAGVFVSA